MFKELENFLKEKKLTNHELRVLIPLAKGQSQKQVSEDIGITPASVRTIACNAYKKLGIKNRFHFEWVIPFIKKKEMEKERKENKEVKMTEFDRIQDRVFSIAVICGYHEDEEKIYETTKWAIDFCHKEKIDLLEREQDLLFTKKIKDWFLGKENEIKKIKYG